MSDFDNFWNPGFPSVGYLQKLLYDRLHAQLNSPIAQTQKIYQADIQAAGLPAIEPVATTTSNEISYLNDIFLNFTYPVFSTAHVDTILAFSFGNRPNPVTGALPIAGPVNEQIAEAVYKLYEKNLYKRWPQSHPVIYAQWEVANVLAAKYRLSSPVLNPVSPPTVSAQGTVTEPALASVVSAVIALAAADTLGDVAVVTHRDQMKSAIEAAAGAGLNAAAVVSLALPTDYDTEATSPANRQRYLFLLSDMVNQFALLRANLIAEEYPNG